MISHTWERPLLQLALEGPVGTLADPELYDYDSDLLRQAYAHCDQLTAEHSRSFFLSSGLLPTEKRRAARALYAFCRVTDDIVDRPDVDTSSMAGRVRIRSQVSQWSREAFARLPEPTDPVALAWADARVRYAIPERYGLQLIDGVLCDLEKTRYQTFAELAAYSYGVASTVGLMSMHIIGYTDHDAIPYAIRLGVALQLTNILRDVGEDWRNGRLYLPQDELAAFGLSEEDIERGEVTDRWREFMRFQIDRNRRLYEEAWPGIGFLNGDGRFAIAAAAGLYRAILTDIEAHDYDVFNRRAYIGKWGKFRRLPQIWWQSRDRYFS